MTRSPKWMTVFLLVIVSLLISQCSRRNEPTPTTEAAATELPTGIATTVSTTGLTPGDMTLTVNTGIERTALLHVPANYDPAHASPLVIVLHGFGLKAEDMVRITGFNDEADQSGFLVVYPQGSGDKSAWNGGNCCGEAAVMKVDDVAFINQLIDEIMRIASVDPQRIYATGFSNGAIMSYRLACDLGSRIASVAPVSAAMEYPSCHPSRAISVLHFHGTADRLNPYEGGEIPNSKMIATSVDDTIQFWVQQDGCPSQPATESKGSILHDTYAPCAQDTAVELYTIQGGEHAWPGGEAVTEQIGEPNMEISATAIMWAFFSDHPLPSE
jgi:polyhydroxybutyrate depolymerase